MDKENLEIYKNLFRGRSDVYPRRWEKNGKSGWSPAYSFDWNEFNAHRTRGGTIKDFENKTLMPLTDKILENHLNGKDTIGVYPILPDNTSYFIAADFDEASWRVDAANLIRLSSEYGLKAYSEISRSGNGAHVWVFFDDIYPCFKSRKIMLALISKMHASSEFKKEESFDRLFPNQDSVSDGGFGNLIGLPLQGERVETNCAVFYDSENNKIHEDQWKFLKAVHRHPVTELDSVYEELFAASTREDFSPPTSGHLHILIDGDIVLNRAELPKSVVNFIKEELNIFNKEYGMKKNLGKSVFGTERYFHLVNEVDGKIMLPRGFLSKLIEFLDAEKIAYEIEYTKRKITRVQYENLIELKPEQNDAVEQCLKYTNGILIAPPGSGKTVMALEMVARLKLPTIILVNRNQLLHQWVERIEQFLGIPKAHIGVISGVKKKLGKQITVATLQSLVRYKDMKEIQEKFGVVFIDECHHIPAKTYRETIRSFRGLYFYGLTATHKRRHDQHIITELCIGPVIAEIKDIQSAKGKSFDIQIIESNLELPFRYKNDHYEILAKTISYDTVRNKLIVDSVLPHLDKNRKILVLTERKEHIEILSLYLRNHTEIITLSGDDSLRERRLKYDQIKSGNFRVLIATGQLFGEGLDIDGFDVLVLAFPISFDGKLKQYTGRLRGKGIKYIIDTHDSHVEFLDKQFKKRRKVYDSFMPI